MQWYIHVLKNYVNFSGRARRKEYWMFFLINMIVSVILAVVEAGLGIPPIVSGVYMLAILLPSIALCIRRVHDTGRSGWWFLINFIPLVGAIVWLVFSLQDSKTGDNQFGPNPKQGAVEA